MKNEKGNIALMVIILLVSAGIITWMFLRNSSVSTIQSVVSTKKVQQINVPDGWRTYTNSKHAYSIGYPGDWNVNDHNDEVMREFLDDDTSFINPKSIGLSDNINDGNNGNLEITVFTNFKSPKPGLIKDKNVPTISEWKAGIAQRPGATVGPSKFLEDEKILGMRCAVNKIQGHFQKYCVKDDKGYLFSISFSGERDIAMGEEIISTFKFLK